MGVLSGNGNAQEKESSACGRKLRKLSWNFPVLYRAASTAMWTGQDEKLADDE